MPLLYWIVGPGGHISHQMSLSQFSNTFGTSFSCMKLASLPTPPHVVEEALGALGQVGSTIKVYG